MKNIIQKYVEPSIKNALNLFLIFCFLLGTIVQIIVEFLNTGYFVSNFITNIFFVLMILSLILAIKKQNFNVADIFSIKKINYKIIILSVLIGIVAYFIGNCLFFLVKVIFNFNPIISISKTSGKSNSSIYFYIFSLTIFAPLTEELLFRGYILNVFKKFGFIQAIIFTSFLFGFLHADTVEHIVSAGFMGLILGYMLYRTRSLFSCILAHAAANATFLAFLLLYLYKFDLHTKLYISTILVVPASILLFLLFKVLQKETVGIEPDTIKFKGFRNNCRSLFNYWQFWIVFLFFIFIILKSILK